MKPDDREKRSVLEFLSDTFLHTMAKEKTSKRRGHHEEAHEHRRLAQHPHALPIMFTALLVITIALYVGFFPKEFSTAVADIKAGAAEAATAIPVPQLDKAAYDKKLWLIANNGLPLASSTLPTGAMYGALASTTKKTLWPVHTVYPNAGALLPFNRIVAYYGNFYSTGMGVLGQYPPDQMIAKLKATVASWQAADPSTPVIPAIDYIAVTAQASAGADGKYRARMPASQIQKAIDLANQVNGIVVLDVQVGLSTLQTELPLLAPYLKLPNVHLAIDPEFSMKDGVPPGHEIGTFSSSDVNYAANFLAKLVDDNNLPPKILVIHRFTEDMVTGYKNITPMPEVQLVMDMDGWGSAAKKKGTYTYFIEDEPVQFTGFKLFYKNDLKPPSTAMMTPAQLLNLTPEPLFIQYQ